MRVGYVRVSTVDQSTARQLDGVDVERTYTDTASGKDTARPRLEELLAFVRDGDTVVVHSMDRLARNLDDLRRLVRTLTAKGVQVEFVKEHLVFSGEDSPMATLLLSVMGAFAEFERSLILERQREGIAAAKARGGVYTGRKPSLAPAQAADLRRRAAAGESKAALAREYGVSRETVYAYLRPAPSTPAAPSDPASNASGTVDGVTHGPAPVTRHVTHDPAPGPVPVTPDREPVTPARGPVAPGPAAAAAVPVRQGRVADLSAGLGDPEGIWQVAETEPGSGSWAVLRDGVRVGIVRRESTTRGQRGWLARLDTGVPLPAHGDAAAAAGSTLWRTRDLAAAAIARQEAARPAQRQRARHPASGR